VSRAWHPLPTLKALFFWLVGLAYAGLAHVRGVKPNGGRHDPEASQTDCDDDSDLSRQLREGFNQPFFHTRKEAIAWCARIAVTEPAIYNITTTDLRDYPISVPEVYHCPDGKPHAVVTWSPVIVPPGTYHEVRMRYPEHTFFRPGNWLWSPREVPAEEAAKTIEAWRDMAKYRGAAP